MIGFPKSSTWILDCCAGAAGSNFVGRGSDFERPSFEVGRERDAPVDCALPLLDFLFFLENKLIREGSLLGSLVVLKQREDRRSEIASGEVAQAAETTNFLQNLKEKERVFK